MLKETEHIQQKRDLKTIYKTEIHRKQLAKPEIGIRDKDRNRLYNMNDICIR